MRVSTELDAAAKDADLPKRCLSLRTALFTIALLLSFTLTYDARPQPFSVLSDEPLDVQADVKD
ncbi:hypothetical protein SADUNF_Sadunf14G0005600 [Salix dunnii]|uniref:Uncharacterized protein n=1 Tax=Salix dunnii TaxID=1413687 RepID=A0A835JF04_9ROSI|nr:hypothetical protein SADUNF_Sadunf14G0005600 [Salix dunnii]